MVDRVGVSTTHNEPSTLTREEKVLRRQRRALTQEIVVSEKTLTLVLAKLLDGNLRPNEIASLRVRKQELEQAVETATYDLAALEGVSGVN